MSNTNRIQESIGHATEATQDFTSEHPVSSTMVAFGLGLGLGVALVYLLSDEPAGRHHAGLAQRLGRQMLDTMSKAVPDSLAHLGR